MKSRLGKLEYFHGDPRADRAHHRALMQKIAGLVLNAIPDMKLVRPADTDEQTYAEIEEIRLRAAGRHEEAEALQRWLAQFEPEPPPEVLGQQGALAAWSVSDKGGWRQERDRANEKALAAARARVKREQERKKPAAKRRAR